MSSPVPPPGRPAWLRDDPTRWRPGTLDREGLHAAATALQMRPGFDALMRRFADCWLQTQADHPELRAVFRNTQRYLLLVASLVLHHRRDAADPASGVTSGRLLAFFQQQVSPVITTGAGQVKSMLAHARLHRLIEPLSSAGSSLGSVDARLRPLQPTRRLQETMSAWVEGFLRAMEGEPSLQRPATTAQLLQTPGLVPEMFAYRMAALQVDRFALFEGQPMLRWVLAHDGGYRVYLQLLSAIEVQADGSALARVRPAVLAQRAVISRGTARNLMLSAAAQGWQAEGIGVWRASAQALATARHWVALELVWMHGLVCAAWQVRRRPSEEAGRGR